MSLATSPSLTAAMSYLLSMGRLYTARQRLYAGTAKAPGVASIYGTAYNIASSDVGGISEDNQRYIADIYLRQIGGDATTTTRVYIVTSADGLFWQVAGEIDPVVGAVGTFKKQLVPLSAVLGKVGIVIEQGGTASTVDCTVDICSTAGFLFNRSKSATLTAANCADVSAGSASDGVDQAVLTTITGAGPTWTITLPQAYADTDYVACCTAQDGTGTANVHVAIVSKAAGSLVIRPSAAPGADTFVINTIVKHT